MKLWTLIRATVSKPGVQQDPRENTQRTKTNSARPPPAGNRQTESQGLPSPEMDLVGKLYIENLTQVIIPDDHLACHICQILNELSWTKTF